MELLHTQIPYKIPEKHSTLLPKVSFWFKSKVEMALYNKVFDSFDIKDIKYLFTNLELNSNNNYNLERLNYLYTAFSALIYKTNSFKELYFVFDNISELLFEGELFLDIQLKDKSLNNNAIHEYIAGFLDFNSKSKYISVNSFLDTKKEFTELSVDESIISEYFSVYYIKTFPTQEKIVIQILESILVDFKIKYNYLLRDINLLAKAYLQPLTKIGNRSYIDEISEDLFLKNSEFSILFIDLNNFKSINDTYGHDSGDEVLINFGQLLKEICNEKGVVGHYGGDEFVILLEKMTKNEALSIANSITEQTFGKISFLGKNEVHFNKITASIGVSTKNDLKNNEGFSIKDLFKDADLAMFNAKKIGDKKYGFVSHFDDLN